MRCDLCGSDRIATKYQLKEYKIFECRNCGLVFSDPSLVDKAEEIYSDEYFKKRKYFSECTKDYDLKSPKIRDFDKILRRILKFKKSGKLLDVGCATGVFPHMAGKRGFKPYGVELSSYASDYARKNFNIDVRNGNLERAGFKDNFFDVITMLDVLEHMQKPSSALDKARSLLEDDGILFVVTMNENSLLNKIGDILYKISFGAFTYPIKRLHDAHHITHFSDKTIVKMLKKHGFRVEYFERDEVPVESLDVGFFMGMFLRAFYVLERMAAKKD